MQSTLEENVNQLSDYEIGERKSDLTKMTERLENLAKMVYNLLECSNSLVDKEVMADYSNITRLQENYAKDVNNEAKIRKTLKQELFNVSELRISLPNF